MFLRFLSEAIFPHFTKCAGQPAQELAPHSLHLNDPSAALSCSWHRSQLPEEILNPSLTFLPGHWALCSVQSLKYSSYNHPFPASSLQPWAARPTDDALRSQIGSILNFCLQLMYSGWVNYAYLTVYHHILPPTIIKSHQIWSSQRPRPTDPDPALASHLRYRWLSCSVESPTSSQKTSSDLVRKNE